tara:strand:- start:224 stop:622 length:399 start_codon:yes stop_codon:yes gene_type:complete
MFIGLNPSTADENKDDPTIRRCIKFAKSWDYGGVYVTNLFSYRSNSPRKMKNFCNPIGNENDKWIKKLSKKSDLIIAAWGNDGIHLNRFKAILNQIPNLKYIRKNKSGQPSHPLYLKSNLKPKILMEKHFNT